MRSAREDKVVRRLHARGKTFEFIAEYITNRRTPGPKGYIAVKTASNVAWDAFRLGLVTEEEREAWYRKYKRNQARLRSKGRNHFRDTVLQRDCHRCVVCGSSERLEVDHIVDFREVQVNDPANGITLCAACHAKKTRPARFSPYDRYDSPSLREKERRMVDEHNFARRYMAAIEKMGYAATYAWCAECRGHHIEVEEAAPGLARRVGKRA